MKLEERPPSDKVILRMKNRIPYLLTGIIPILFILLALFFFKANNASAQTGDLHIEIVSGYNLVVDSNVQSPSTYAPSVATVAGKFCNTGGSTISGVQGFIGDFGNAPGIYPSRSGPVFDLEHPHLAGTGSYAYTHVGGETGTADATRYVGDLAPGECKFQYWHFTYPQCANTGAGVAVLPPCGANEPVWGATNNPNDDLWLEYDIWGTSADGSHTDDQTRKMTMRNEISAMANKIEPNPNGKWFNTNENEIFPGDIITSNGVLYDLGNINQGFDNDGDFAPDYNAWMQPIGDPSYDPSCFRLIRTSGVITMSRSAKPDKIIPFADQLYFSNLPPDNNGSIGEVFYTFQALNGPCSTSLTPYQEVASGFDNEKFNGDYGTGIPPIGSSAPEITFDKNGNSTVSEPGTINYSIPFQNSGSIAAPSLPLSTGTMPLVVSDTVPDGLVFNSAGATFSAGYAGSYTVRYSIDSGQTWSATAPTGQTSTAPNALIMMQWWLDDQLPVGVSGSATLQASVPATYTSGGGNSFIENCADISFGGGVSMLEACTITAVQGSNSIGDTVWQDDGGTTGISSNGLQDGDEVGIVGIDVTLYWDKNGDGLLDSDDVSIGTTTTVAAGYYQFDQLPDGDYLVVVDKGDVLATLTGYSATTAETHVVTNLNITDYPTGYEFADFGFGPSLEVIKNLTSGDPSYEGQEVTYTIEVNNLRPGNGTDQPASCEYIVWSSADETATYSPPKVWTAPLNAVGPIDGFYAQGSYTTGGNQEQYGTGFDIGYKGGTITGVEAIFQVYLNGSVIDDSADIALYDAADSLVGARQPISSATLNTYSPNSSNVGLLAVDMTNIWSRTWEWGDFPVVDLELKTLKQGSSDTAILNLDAMGFHITTDQICGGSSDTLDPVPLTDTFDSTKLQFVSASPTETSVSGNTISWDNVGPLYGGGTATINLTFIALEPLNNTATTHTNTASVQNAKFLNGDDANDDDDSVTHTINPTASIGDTVWNDNGSGGGTANDGIEQPGEPGIPGVLVSLTANVDVTINGVIYTAGSVIMTDVTDANGEYLFEGLPDATYTVTVDETSLSGMTFTGGPHGIVNNAPLVVVSGADVTSIGGTSCTNCELDVDFGYTIPNAIYGNIWQDVNGDATQDAGENGISGVTVYLCDSTSILAAPPCNSANAIANTTTDPDGNYLFDGLLDETYYVGVDNSSAPLGTDWTNTVDPESTPGNHQTGPIVASGGNTYGSLDFGYHQTGSSTIGDTIYTDWNGDGTQDNGEEGIDNVDVSLYQDTNNNGVYDPGIDALVETQTTSSGGQYTFEDLPAGDYFVVVDKSTLPNNHAQTGDPEQPGVPCTICDGQSSVTGVTGVFGDDHLFEDFGYQPIGSGSIGDRVWQDDDGDGIQDSGELGLANITVTLYEDTNGNGVIDNADAVVGTVSTADGTGTDPIGFYEFTGLPAGDYLVDVDTDDPQLPVDGSDPYVLSTNNDPHLVSLATGEAYVDADFGFTVGGVIGDFIWQDNNGDGLQDSNEPGISGVLVELQDGSCTPLPAGGADCPTVTTVDGLYEFTGLPAGDYTVVVVSGTPVGSTQTYDPDEPNGLIPCGTCNGAADVTLTPGQIDRSIDFGYEPQGVIGDTVWIDSNGDGVKDASEPGIAGVTVELRDGSCTPLPAGGANCPTVETNDSGYYSFGNLPDASYTIVVDPEGNDIPAGLTQTYEPGNNACNPGCSTTASTTLNAGNNHTDMSLDFGYRYAGNFSIAGTVFYDDGAGTPANRDNAVQDPGEDTTYSNTTIYLWRGSTYVGSMKTDVNGDYLFENLAAGTYTVSVNSSAPNLAGMDPTVTTTPTTYRTVTIGPNAIDQDFGVLSSLDFGDLPDTYNTTLDNDGARHTVLGGLYLGSSVTADNTDKDPNGQVDANAGRLTGGDDGDGFADEDGVKAVFGNPWGDGSGQIEVDVTGSGCLLGWIDWNDSGTFDAGGTTGGVSELLVNQFVTTGADQIINITSPLVGDFGTDYNTEMFVRFRLFPVNDARFGSMAVDGNGCPTNASDVSLFTLSYGQASDGEVEDYEWLFTGPTAVSLSSFSANNNMVGLVSLVIVLGLLLVAGSFITILRRKATE